MTAPAATASPIVPHIITAMGDIMELVDAIEKVRQHGTPGEPGPKFKFRGIDDVLNALHPHFAKKRVLIIPVTLDQKTEVRPTKSGTTLHTVVKARFDFVSTVDGSQWPASPILPGEAADTGDKGHGKAMAYALKLALIQVFLIPTEGDNDPDGTSHEWTAQQGQRNDRPPQQNQGQRSQQGTSQQQQRQSKDGAEKTLKSKIQEARVRFLKCPTKLEVHALANDAQMFRFLDDLKLAHPTQAAWLKRQIDTHTDSLPET